MRAIVICPTFARLANPLWDRPIFSRKATSFCMLSVMIAYTVVSVKLVLGLLGYFVFVDEIVHVQHVQVNPPTDSHLW